MASKYYAVKKGKSPGIYMTWDECKAQVNGFSGAIYKSFKTKEEAEAFIGGDIGDTPSKIKMENSTNTINATNTTTYAFVDGSYNVATGVYGYGGFLVSDNTKYTLQGAGDDAEMASMRNVAGEILGSQAAIEKAIELGLNTITIYYDYMGIEMWAKGLWKRNKAGTISYYEFIKSCEDKIDIEFVKVKGHSGVEGNEEADRLAKEAVGIE